MPDSGPRTVSRLAARPSVVCGGVGSIVLLLATLGSAGPYETFGPRDVVTAEDPMLSERFSFSFTTVDPGSTFSLRIDNGGADGDLGKVDLGTIELNGAEVVGPLELNLLAGRIEKGVTLRGSNELTVELTKLTRVPRGPPGGITVTIFGEDDVPPVVEITSPPDGSVQGPGATRVTGTAADAVSGIESVDCNGTPGTYTAPDFTCDVPLEPGPNEILVEAMDRAGNTSTASVTVVPAPRVTIDSPASQELFNASPIDVCGTVESSSGAVTVEVNGVAASVSGASFCAQGVPLHEGANLIAARAADGAGNTGTATITVTLDTTPPRLVIECPVEGATLVTSPITVAGTVNDAVVGTVNAAQVEVLCNGIEAEVSNRTFVASEVLLLAGPNTITCTATDAAGNVADARVGIFFDTTPQNTIRMVSGNDQTAEIGQSLLEPLVASLRDETGAPVAGKKVVFRVTQNDGVVASGSDTARAVVVTSDANGRAEVLFRLGSRAGSGNNHVRAAAVGFAGEVVFTASALSGAPARIVVDSGDAQTGVTGRRLPRPFHAIVIDSGNNRLEGVPVTFEVARGGGSFAGAGSVTVDTDSDGRAAAVLNLGPAEGFDNNRVRASIAGASGFPATFVASGRHSGDPSQTSVSGTVLDNMNMPVAGVTVRIAGTSLATQSDGEGQFFLASAPVGGIHLVADGSTATRPGTWPTLEFELVTVAGVDNTIGMPVYLLPLDDRYGLAVNPTTGGTLTIPHVPGFSLTVAPGSATFPDGSQSGVVTVTVVHPDKVPMVPNFGQQPRFVVTIQPAGTHFEPPAAITIPNADGLSPGRKTDMYSFDHDIGQFVSLGTGTVSRDGSVISSDPGIGIIKGGWHGGGDPAGSGGCAGGAAPHPSGGSGPLDGGSGSGPGPDDRPPCEADSSCEPDDCDDGKPCTDDFVVNGKCNNLNVPAGTSCLSAPDTLECGGGLIGIADCGGSPETKRDGSGTCDGGGKCVEPDPDPQGPTHEEMYFEVLFYCEGICADDGGCAGEVGEKMKEGHDGRKSRILCNGDCGGNPCACSPEESNTIVIAPDPDCFGSTLENVLRHEFQHQLFDDLAHEVGTCPDGSENRLCENDTIFACDLLCSGIDPKSQGHFGRCCGADVDESDCKLPPPPTPAP